MSWQLRLDLILSRIVEGQEARAVLNELGHLAMEGGGKAEPQDGAERRWG